MGTLVRLAAHLCLMTRPDAVCYSFARILLANLGGKIDP